MGQLVEQVIPRCIPSKSDRHNTGIPGMRGLPGSPGLPGDTGSSGLPGRSFICSIRRYQRHTQFSTHGKSTSALILLTW